jgi:hypothetical protein
MRNYDHKGSMSSVVVRARTHCKEAFHINTNRAFFLACCCSCVCEFMNECLYVLVICCRCVLVCICRLQIEIVVYWVL